LFGTVNKEAAAFSGHWAVAISGEGTLLVEKLTEHARVSVAVRRQPTGSTGSNQRIMLRREEKQAMNYRLETLEATLPTTPHINPMWGHFGDATHETHPLGTEEHRPAGTCYYRAAESRWYYWNVFDQVLFRPSLLPFFRSRELRVLVTDGVSSPLNASGLPDRDRASDHLPLLLRLRP
jgi:hypothetical protein